MHVTVGFANTVFISKLPSNCWALWKATVMWADCTQGTARGQAAAASLPSPLRAQFGPLRRTWERPCLKTDTSPNCAPGRRWGPPSKSRFPHQVPEARELRPPSAAAATPQPPARRKPRVGLPSAPRSSPRPGPASPRRGRRVSTQQ